MSNTHNIYLISDSTGETLDRIFTALKAQFEKFDHNLFHFSFTRTENQLLKILEDAKRKEESIILYTIVDNKLAKFLSQEASKKNIPCFGVLGDLILNFSKLKVNFSISLFVYIVKFSSSLVLFLFLISSIIF